MKNFYEYLSGVKREYNYKLKLAVKVDDTVMDKVEKVLKRYDAIEISKAKKSILQRDEIDFPGIGPVESYTIRITTERPLVAQSLTNDLKHELNISERFVRVRGENEPVAVEDRFVEEMLGVVEAAGDDEVATLLGHDEVAEEQGESFGDKYNQTLLNYLAQIQANRAKEMDEATPHKSMFGLLHDLTATEDAAFNAKHDGVRPVSGSTLSAKEAKAPLDTAPTGNFDSRIQHASRTVVKNGKATKIKGK